jgi:hypothetical protein
MNRQSSFAETGRLWMEDALNRAVRSDGDHVVFAHAGPLDHARVQALLAEAEGRSLKAAEGLVQRKRMMNVLVEGLENVSRHVHDQHAQAGFALLVRTDEGYRMSFGNPVPMVTATLLTHRVGIINQMDEADLKDHYLAILGNSERSQHGGAGLGLLTMARKVLRPMEVRTARISPDASMFMLELRLAA